MSITAEDVEVAPGNTGDMNDPENVGDTLLNTRDTVDLEVAPGNTGDIHDAENVGDTFLDTRDTKDVEDTPGNAGDAKNYMLVVCTLIAAVTFQTGISPPGGVWQETTQDHLAGTAIFASQKEPYYLFLIANSLAFSSSLVVMAAITYRLPFWIEIWFSMCCMFVTYVSAFLAVNFPGSDTASFNPVMFIPIVLVGTYILIKYCD